jgi:hypothetical protein
MLLGCSNAGAIFNGILEEEENNSIGIMWFRWR